MDCEAKGHCCTPARHPLPPCFYLHVPLTCSLPSPFSHAIFFLSPPVEKYFPSFFLVFFLLNFSYYSTLFLSSRICSLDLSLTAVSVLKMVRIWPIWQTPQYLNLAWQVYFLYLGCFSKWQLKTTTVFKSQVFQFTSCSWQMTFSYTFDKKIEGLKEELLQLQTSESIN